jgi:hypothetical protein
MKVALYVNSSMGANTVPWHTQKCWSSGYSHDQDYPIIESSDSVLNPEEEKIKKLLEECAGKYNIDYEVYDIALKSIGRKAWFKGIRKTPVLILNGKKTYEMPTTEQELALLFTTGKCSVKPSENDSSIVSKKVILYTKPQKIMSMEPRIFDHIATLGIKMAASTEVIYSPGEEQTLKRLRDLETQGRIRLHIKDLNNRRTMFLARLRGIKTPSVRVVYGNKRPDSITRIENSKPNDLENLIIPKPSAGLPVKARESTKYLKWVPVKFGLMLSLIFLTLLTLFRFIESRAASYTEIHDTLWFYMFLLALLPSISGLIDMMEHYFDMRISETMLIRYLQRLGVYGAY